MVCIDSASATASDVATASSTVPAASPPPQPLIAKTMADSEKIPDLNARIFNSDSAKNNSRHHDLPSINICHRYLRIQDGGGH
jgi:hypothetical protein